MTLQELGAKLRSAREEKRIMVEDAAIALKLSAKLLNALEEGDVRNLPQAVFIHNFIREYGRYLGICEEELRLDLESAISLSPVAPSDNRYQIIEPRKYSLSLIFPALIVLLVTVLGAYALYANWNTVKESCQHFFYESKLKTEQAASFIFDKSNQNAAKNDLIASENIRKSHPSNEGADSEKLSVAKQPEAQKSTVLQPSHQDNRLVVIGMQQCTVRYQYDGMAPIEYTLQKGGTLALSFSKKLEILFDNIGNVRITYNDKDVPRINERGEYKMVFPQ